MARPRATWGRGAGTRTGDRWSQGGRGPSSPSKHLANKHFVDRIYTYIYGYKLIAGTSLSKCTYYGELALKTPKPRNPKYRMCGCQAGGAGCPRNPRPPGQPPGAHPGGHTGTALPSTGQGAPTLSLPNQRDRRGLRLGGPPVTPGDTHLPSHEQESASYFCATCRSLESTLSCSQGKGGGLGQR